MSPLVGLAVLAVLAAVSALGVAAPRWESSTNMDPAQFYSLKFVAVVTRHGSRSPLNTWPSDAYPYTDKRFWPAGPTQLTRYGKMQMYRVGKVLRNRYSGFLPEEYFPNDTLAEYNPYDRDFGSAACLLAGLYPPIGQEVWNDRLPWQPIRMYLHQFDICDLSNVGVCPTFLEEYNNERSRYDEESTKFQALLDNLTNHTGKTISTLTEVADVYDTLIMQQQNGYKLPSWANRVMAQMHPINVKTLILGYAGNNKLLQLGAGEELRYLSGLIDAKANDKMPNTRLYVQAAHDCTLVAILRAMGRTEMDLEIQTGAFIAIELHEIKPTHFVQVWFFRNRTSVPEQINIKGCSNPCSLDGFNSFVEVWAPKDWQEMCKLNRPSERQDHGKLRHKIEEQDETSNWDLSVHNSDNGKWTDNDQIIERENTEI